MEHEVRSYVLKNLETGKFYSYHDVYDGYFVFVDFPSEQIQKWENINELHEYVRQNPVLKDMAICDYTVTTWIGDPI